MIINKLMIVHKFTIVHKQNKINAFITYNVGKSTINNRHEYHVETSFCASLMQV